MQTPVYLANGAQDLETDYIFHTLPSEIQVGRYHSWVVNTDGLPQCLAITAVSAEGQIMLITPETSKERVREIDAHTDGFIYMVSSAATTGAQSDFDGQKRAYFQKIAGLGLRNPRMVGFGISNRATFEAAWVTSGGQNNDTWFNTNNGKVY